MKRFFVIFALLLCITIGIAGNSFAYDAVSQSDFVQKVYSEGFKKKIEDKFGEYCVQQYCGEMLKVSCMGGANRGNYFVDEALNPIDPACPGNCKEEPKSWTQCMEVKNYAGEPAGMLTQGRVKMKYGSECKVKETCDDMLYVDCNSPADGPAYYLDGKLEVIGTSGGLCMAGRCSGAPKEWKECTVRVTKELQDKMK